METGFHPPAATTRILHGKKGVPGGAIDTEVLVAAVTEPTRHQMLDLLLERGESTATPLLTACRSAGRLSANTSPSSLASASSQARRADARCAIASTSRDLTEQHGHSANSPRHGISDSCASSRSPRRQLPSIRRYRGRRLRSPSHQTGPSGCRLKRLEYADSPASVLAVFAHKGHDRANELGRPPARRRLSTRRARARA